MRLSLGFVDLWVGRVWPLGYPPKSRKLSNFVRSNIGMHSLLGRKGH
jgi:hypothetical protein